MIYRHPTSVLPFFLFSFYRSISRSLDRFFNYATRCTDPIRGPKLIITIEDHARSRILPSPASRLCCSFPFFLFLFPFNRPSINKTRGQDHAQSCTRLVHCSKQSENQISKSDISDPSARYAGVLNSAVFRSGSFHPKRAQFKYKNDAWTCTRCYTFRWVNTLGLDRVELAATIETEIVSLLIKVENAVSS